MDEKNFWLRLCPWFRVDMLVWLVSAGLASFCWFCSFLLILLLVAPEGLGSFAGSVGSALLCWFWWLLSVMFWSLRV